MSEATRQDGVRWHRVAYDVPEPHRGADDETPVAGRQRAVSTSSAGSRRRARRASVADEERYRVPDAWANLDELAATSPVENVTDAHLYRRQSLEDTRSHERAHRRDSSRPRPRRPSVVDGERYTLPDSWTNLDELAATSPVENVTDAHLYRHHSLEEVRNDEQAYRRDELRRASLHQPALPEPVEEKPAGGQVSKLLTEVYALSYLVLFSLLGTLARLGLTALTRYPNTPVTFATVWANFGGSLVMGFLAEDRMLFRHEWGTPTYDLELARAKRDDEETGSGSAAAVDLAAAKKAHVAAKKTIPLYIGLATGFCGSFTSFSAFIRDAFLALSDDLAAPDLAGAGTVARNGGYSFMAMLAVIVTTVCLSMSGLFLGAHLAIASERFTPSIPFPITRRVLDPLAVLLGWGCWLGAVLLSVFPPDDDWRGRATFALVFAPLGCLLRFYLAVHLNGRVASFPLGTFAANVFGTAVLGMAWDLANVPVGGLVGCQVLQGVEDGFCGCLTTVSTWVAELSSLRRRSSYVYGTASVAVSLALMIAIMGGLRWTDGFNALSCH